jgi:protein involved in polysaccharide export with SLBB domain
MDGDYVVRAGDRLSLTVYGVPELNQDIRVPPNGQVTLLRLEAPIQASGRSVRAFRRAIQDAYLEKFRLAEVSLLLLEAAISSVYVAGEVRSPGAIPYDPNLTLLKAVSAAGGTLITAKPSEVIITRKDGRAKNRSFRVNLDEILYGPSPDFPLLPGDVVWAQTSGIADAGNWVELWIRRLLPISFSPVGVAPASSGQ